MTATDINPKISANTNLMLQSVEHNPEPEPESAQRESSHAGPHHSSPIDIIVVHIDVVIIVEGIVDELSLIVVSEENVPYLGLL
jgi:hypothetical protein